MMRMIKKRRFPGWWLLFLPGLLLGQEQISSDQQEADSLRSRLVDTNILKTMEAFENREDQGIPLEVTRESLTLGKLSLILRLFLDVQEENYLLRQQNIEKIVIGSIFATTRGDETYQQNGVSFNKLRLFVNAAADSAELENYFANPFGAMRSASSAGADDDTIEELEGFYVRALNALDRPRALNFSREFNFGESLEGRLIGSTGPDTQFSQFNFRFQIEDVENAELESFDPRTGEFEVEVEPDFYGTVDINYRVQLFGELSSLATHRLRVEPPLLPVVDTYDLRAGRPVDILYVVDNSSGTEKQQEVLGESFVNFIEAFGAYNRKIRVAAIATSSTSAWTGDLLALPSGEKILSSSDPAFVEKVTQLIQPGAEKEKRQSAILPSNNFFASPMRKEFLREGAFFSMIIISQKDDDYLETGDPEKIMEVYRHTMSVIKPKGDLRVDAVVKYGTKSWWGTSNQGKVYAQLAREFGGRVIDITQDFTDDLIAIGYEISRQAQESFLLAEEVYIGALSTMQVYVAEEMMPRDPVNGWSYNPETNRVILHGDALDKSFGQVVKVYYSTIDDGRFTVSSN